jgi:hypothetical protein
MNMKRMQVKHYKRKPKNQIKIIIKVNSIVLFKNKKNKNSYKLIKIKEELTMLIKLKQSLYLKLIQWRNRKWPRRYNSLVGLIKFD